MIRFTSGTLFKVISLCKSGRRYADDTIASMLFPNVQYTTNYIAHVKDCTKNLPDEITQYMSSTNREDIIRTLNESVRDVFTSVISTDRQPYLIAAIQQLLDDDKTITGSAQIGYDASYTKETMINATTVKPVEFIANALFCVCNQQNNQEGRADIRRINLAYINALEDKSRSLTLQTSDSDLVELPEKMDDDFPYFEDDEKLLKEFTADYDEIMYTMISEKYAASIIDMSLPVKIQNLYETKWKTKADSFSDPTLKSYVFRLLGELNQISNNMFSNNNGNIFIRKTRVTIRNLYVRLHPDLFAGSFPYDAFIDDWNDGEF